ncbi:hypothetical protein [Campylobacter troglodytis]|uniref:hypothetical protein n=1 Tax=Campylobacter troglodytis TaxID=654363 RepID=UPI0011575DCB|nr:hypothetical protein [Campylobacter troglodytis]TQR52299.1 hypothetical protein DMC01_12485 [Campylobacter troglodytis]
MKSSLHLSKKKAKLNLTGFYLINKIFFNAHFTSLLNTKKALSFKYSLKAFNPPPPTNEV